MIGILNIKKCVFYFDNSKLYIQKVDEKQFNENYQVFKDEQKKEKVGAGWNRINNFGGNYIKFILNLKNRNEYLIGRQSKKKDFLYFMEFDKKTIG